MPGPVPFLLSFSFFFPFCTSPLRSSFRGLYLHPSYHYQQKTALCPVHSFIHSFTGTLPSSPLRTHFCFIRFFHHHHNHSPTLSERQKIPSLFLGRDKTRQDNTTNQTQTTVITQQHNSHAHTPLFLSLSLSFSLSSIPPSLLLLLYSSLLYSTQLLSLLSLNPSSSELCLSKSGTLLFLHLI